MNALKTGTQGVPLTIVETDQYRSWLEQQPETLQNWLSSTGYMYVNKWLKNY